jgi:hypothetical protein
MKQGGEARNDSNVVFRSTNGGATWEVVFPIAPPAYLAGSVDGAGCAVYAQTRFPHPPFDYTINGVVRSLDLGKTWSNIGGPSTFRDTRISVVARGAICYTGDGSGSVWKFVDSTLLRNTTWDLTLKKTSTSISNDTLYTTMCDSAKVGLQYGFISCDYVKLNGITVEGIPTSDYRVDFIKDKVIMEGRSDTSGITFIPSQPGTYPIKIRTYVMRDDWVLEDTAFNLILVVKPNPAVLIYSPHDTITFGKQSLCNNHLVRDTIRIANKGCEALSVKSITLETDAGSKNDFTFTTVSNLLLTQSDSGKIFPVTYFPKNAGQKTGRIIIVTSLGRDTIFLAGIVTANGSLDLSLSTIKFDTVSTCESLTKTAYLVNDNCDSVLISEFQSLSQLGFIKISPSFPFALNPGDSLLVTISFTPKQTGSVSDSITFLGKTSSGKNEYLTLVMAGFGESDKGKLLVTPKSFNFQSLSICNHDSASGNISNIGCDSIALDTAKLFGDQDYKLTANSLQPTVLRPNETITYKIYLDPAQKGLRKGFLVLSSNTIRDSIPLTVFVTDGTRILSSSVNAVDFGTVSVCDHVRDTMLTLHNSGCDTLRIDALTGLNLGFASNTKFPIIILPGKDTTIDIFTLLDTAGGKTSSSATLAFESNSDNTITPITLMQTYSKSGRRDVGYYLDATTKTGGDQNTVSYDIKEIPNKSFSGAGIKQTTFDLAYNTDLLTYEQSLSSGNLSFDGKHFSIAGSDIAADANGVIARVGFRVYLTKDSITSITLATRTDTLNSSCGLLTLSMSGSAEFDYKFLCGERSIQTFLNGVMPMKIISIHPNPAQDEIIVEINGADFCSGTDSQSVNGDGANGLRVRSTGVFVFDALGAKVYSEIRSLPAGKSTIHLPIHDLSQGVYFVRVGDVGMSFVKMK